MKHRKHSRLIGWIGLSSFRSAPQELLRNQDGVSALEFALFAPFLIFTIMASADVGMAVSERMTIGHILRSGAQVATSSTSVATVDQILRTTAVKNMQVAAAGVSGDDLQLSLNVDRRCTCPSQPAVSVECSATCENNDPTQVFYLMSAEKTYSGLILPRFSQARTIQVQLR